MHSKAALSCNTRCKSEIKKKEFTTTKVNIKNKTIMISELHSLSNRTFLLLSMVNLAFGITKLTFILILLLITDFIINVCIQNSVSDDNACGGAD